MRNDEMTDATKSDFAALRAEKAEALLREALSAILLLIGDLRILTSEEDRASFTGLQRGIEVGKRIDAALSAKGDEA